MFICICVFILFRNMTRSLYPMARESAIFAFYPTTTTSAPHSRYSSRQYNTLLSPLLLSTFLPYLSSRRHCAIFGHDHCPHTPSPSYGIPNPTIAGRPALSQNGRSVTLIGHDHFQRTPNRATPEGSTRTERHSPGSRRTERDSAPLTRYSCSSRQYNTLLNPLLLSSLPYPSSRRHTHTLHLVRPCPTPIHLSPHTSTPILLRCYDGLSYAYTLLSPLLLSTFLPYLSSRRHCAIFGHDHCPTHHRHLTGYPTLQSLAGPR